jgi:hypothetical protein
MNARILTVLFAVMLPVLSFGQGSENYQCTLGDLKRRIEIFHETGVSVPCEVHYYKDTEAAGEMQVLWRAMHEAGYCERKTREFIVELEKMGWNCGRNDFAGTSAEPAPVDDPEPSDGPAQVDDTEALIPGEESESAEEN